MQWKAQSKMRQWSTSTFGNSCGCTALEMSEWRKMTEHIDWQAKQPLHVACFLEDLECWGTWDSTCGYKAKDITPSIAWRREAWKEEALDELPWKNQRGSSSIRQTLEPFQRRHRGNFWSAYIIYYGLFRAHRYHLELNWTDLYRTVRSKRSEGTKETLTVIKIVFCSYVRTLTVNHFTFFPSGLVTFSFLLPLPPQDEANSTVPNTPKAMDRGSRQTKKEGIAVAKAWQNEWGDRTVSP